MKRKTAEYSWKPVLQSKSSPCDRFKHACCICRGFLYVYGGRQNTSLNDFWRYKIENNEWERLENSEDGPEELEEHTMVDYQGILYIFGGMVDSAFTLRKNPLWMYDTDSAKWMERQLTAGESEGTAPVNRKGHSAVVYKGIMYMYGGYVDLKGASQEFWTLCLNKKQWTPAVSYGGSPGPRHGHSAVVHGNNMYLFGGLVGLSEQKDFWKWDFMAANWSSIRTSHGPPKVVGHSALIFEDSMLLFGGGISNTRPSSILWKYHFPSRMWKQLARTTEPSSKAFHCMLGIGYGFQGIAGSSRKSLSYLHQKEMGCSKLLAISKQHSCFCEYIHQEPSYQTFSNDGSTEIEMKTFYLSQEEPGFCSRQTTSSSELSANEKACILSERERTSYLNLPREQEFATLDLTEENASFIDLTPASVDIGESSASMDIHESSAVLLLIGGKPLSSSSSISFWQMELDKI
ncbi:ras guanine nucleotide exchange factor F-like isoform X1 [Lacerta agilis]|uniref:ras guanine nucleotide exchange factor F-like isoform X1 n=2 Tax=Lacerta agilis TaxID=80427 RepID=UPI001419CAAF|nr:ras guanine nucleotide exchange factor F-like isoform X1 [Lacerta agilis]XP_033017988.1 ras guanine nucleotide exchange factor F-like isoform X1 [Lacerta agilis]